MARRVECYFPYFGSNFFDCVFLDNYQALLILSRNNILNKDFSVVVVKVCDFCDLVSNLKKKISQVSLLIGKYNHPHIVI